MLIIQLSILDSSQENPIAPIVLWTNLWSDKVNYIVFSLLKLGLYFKTYFFLCSMLQNQVLGDKSLKISNFVIGSIIGLEVNLPSYLSYKLIRFLFGLKYWISDITLLFWVVLV